MSYALVLKGRIWSLFCNHVALRMAKTLWSFGRSESNRANSWCKFEKEDKQN